MDPMGKGFHHDSTVFLCLEGLPLWYWNRSCLFASGPAAISLSDPLFGWFGKGKKCWESRCVFWHFAWCKPEYADNMKKLQQSFWCCFLWVLQKMGPGDFWPWVYSPERVYVEIFLFPAFSRQIPRARLGIEREDRVCSGFSSTFVGIQSLLRTVFSFTPFGSNTMDFRDYWTP